MPSINRKVKPYTGHLSLPEELGGEHEIPSETEVRSHVMALLDEDGNIKSDEVSPQSSRFSAVVVTTSSPTKVQDFINPKSKDEVPATGDTSSQVSLGARMGKEGNSGDWVNLMVKTAMKAKKLADDLQERGKINRFIIITRKPFKESSSTDSRGETHLNVPVLDYVKEEEAQKYHPGETRPLDQISDSHADSDVDIPKNIKMRNKDEELDPVDAEWFEDTEDDETKDKKMSYDEIDVLRKKDNNTTDELLQEAADNAGADIDARSDENSLKDVLAEIAAANEAN